MNSIFNNLGHATFDDEIRAKKILNSQSSRMRVISKRLKHFSYLGHRFAIKRFKGIIWDGRIVKSYPYLECEFITSDGFKKVNFDYHDLRKALYIG